MSDKIENKGDGNSNLIDNSVNTYINYDTYMSEIDLSKDARNVLRDLYGELLNSGGEIHMIAWRADEFEPSIRSELFAEECIERHTVSSIRPTSHGKKIGRLIYKYFPQEYDQEMERIVEMGRNAIKHPIGHMPHTLVIKMESKFTTRIVDKFTRDGILSIRTEMGKELNTNSEGDYERKITPLFKKTYFAE